MRAFLLSIGFCLSALNLSAQGIQNFKTELQAAILRNDTTAVKGLYLKAKMATGHNAGKPLQEPLYGQPDSTPIAFENLEKVWNACLNSLAVWEIGCPEPAVGVPASLLGVLYAAGNRLPGIDSSQIKAIAAMLMAQQFSKGGGEADVARGAFGLVYLPQNEQCAHTGATQRTTATLCRDFPHACPTYTEGYFRGSRFAVADQLVAEGFWEGSIAQQQGWAVECMIQAFLHTGDSSFYHSAILGGKWCLAQHPHVNQYITAKLVWALAALYDFTGNEQWKGRMQYLIGSFLLPGVLTDWNSDGLVDGTEIRFDSMAVNAQIPGRLFDPVNASSWNTAICCWALGEAYASLRNRGNVEEAKNLKPYVLAMMDNLCEELIVFGTPPAGPGFRDLAFCIFQNSWLIEKGEKQYFVKWQKAANIVWNARVLQKGAEFTVNVGQLMRYVQPGNTYKSRMVQP